MLLAVLELLLFSVPILTFPTPWYRSPPDAWQYAIRKYIDTLSESQKATFIAPTSAESCLGVIYGSERRRGVTRVLEIMRPILEPLKRFERVLDAVTQVHGIGSAIWGPVKLAMIVCVASGS